MNTPAPHDARAPRRPVKRERAWSVSQVRELSRCVQASATATKDAAEAVSLCAKAMEHASSAVRNLLDDVQQVRGFRA